MVSKKVLFRQVIICLFVCPLLVLALTSTGYSSSNCPIVTSVQVGSTTGSNRFYAKTMEDAAGGWANNTGKWLIFHPDNQDAMLATLLTGISLDKKIQVCSTDYSYESTTETITQIYLLDQ